MQIKHGINKFKCATISETEMVAKCGGSDILLAMQPVGPNLERFFKLKQTFTKSNISCIADNDETIIQLAEMARKTRIVTHVWIDLNMGMNRTGVIPGEKAARLYRRVEASPKLEAAGLHAYDGHFHESEFAVRQRHCDESFLEVTGLKKSLEAEGIDNIKIIGSNSL